LSRTCGQARAEVGREGIALLARGDEDDAGLGAQLPAERRDRGGQALGDRLAALGQRRLGDDDRVHAAHLGEDRDRALARRGTVVERLAAGERAREADGRDRRLVDERLADLEAAGLQQREGGARQAGRGRGGGQLARDDRAGARMRGVALDDDRASGRERAGGVPARGREGEREVAGTEDRHGADGDEHAPHVRPRDRLGIGVGRVDDRLDVVAGVHHAGEGLQLARRALELAAQARLGEARLGSGHRDDLVARRAQAPGGSAQEGRAPLRIAQVARPERVVRRGHGLVDVGAGGLFEGGPGLACAGIDGMEGA
jgi:hypothetical protein